MEVVMSIQERKKVEAFKWEHKTNFEREQFALQSEAERKGEVFTPSEYNAVSDEEALAAVRAGWISGLERRSNKKRVQDASRGVIWGKPFKTNK